MGMVARWPKRGSGKPGFGEGLVVVIRWALELASTSYGEDKMRERKVREALVGADHERALSSVASLPRQRCV
jgi:hypothetical protein